MSRSNTPHGMSTKRDESGRVTKPRHYRRTTRLQELLKMAAIPLLFLLLPAAVRGQSALDGFDPNANGEIRVVVVQPDDDNENSAVGVRIETVERGLPAHRRRY